MKPKTKAFDVAILGHFAVDRLVERGRVRTSSGGAVYYGGLALARLGFQVAVITKLAERDFPRLWELKAEGIEVFAAAAPQTSGMENIYDETLDHRVCKPLGFAGPFRPEEVPELEARALLIGPILAGEVDLPLLEELSGRFHRQGAKVALDLQGFIRFPSDDGDEVAFRPWPEMAQGLKLIDLLKGDDAEASFLTGERDLRKAAAHLAMIGPAEVLLTHARGALVCTDGEFYEAPFQPRVLRGRTGRGDTCFASYVGFRLERPPDEALQLAAAVTSLKLEHPGPFRGSKADLEAFLNQGQGRGKESPNGES